MKKTTTSLHKTKALFFSRYSLIACFMVSLLLVSCQSIDTNHTAPPKTPKNEFSRPSGVPAMAITVADYIAQNNSVPDGFIGGRAFENRESILPAKDSLQQTIVYREYDIYPHIKGKSRGAERIVLGSDKSRYYTANHYQSFTKF